jgi:hypothetical protein
MSGGTECHGGSVEMWSGMGACVGRGMCVGHGSGRASEAAYGHPSASRSVDVYALNYIWFQEHNKK